MSALFFDSYDSFYEWLHMETADLAHNGSAFCMTVWVPSVAKATILVLALVK